MWPAPTLSSSRLLLVVVAVLAAGCGRDGSYTAPAEPASQPGGTLRYPLYADPASVTPLGVRDRAGLTVARQVFAGLVDFDPATLAVVPSIAQSWTHSDDLRVWTFELRRGVRFQDGSEVTAASFVLDWAAVCASGAPLADVLALVEGYQPCRGGAADGLAGVRAVTRHRLQVTLARPFAEFAAVLTNPVTWAFPPQLDGGRPSQRSPVGAGPFRLVSWKQGERIRLERNPDYFGPAPLPDAIELPIYTGKEGSRQAMTAYRSGQLDAAEVPPSQVLLTKADPQLDHRLVIFPRLSVTLIDPPGGLSSSLLRAIAQGTDGPEVEAAVIRWVGDAADGLAPPGTPGYTLKRSPYPHDPVAARAELAAVGARPRLVVDTVGDDSLFDEAKTLAAGYRRVGLPARAGRPRGETVELSLLRWQAPYPTMDGALLPLLADPEAARLIDRARAEADPLRRAALYDRAAVTALSDVVVIPVTFEATALLFSPRLSGCVVDAAGLPRLDRCAVA